MAQLHRNNSYHCKVCQCSFSRHTKLQHHMASHTPEENMLYGDIFSFTCSSPKEGKQAKQMREKCVCPMCDKSYSNTGHYKKHLWSVHRVSKKLKNPLLVVQDEKKNSLVEIKDTTVKIPRSITDSTSKSDKAQAGLQDTIKFVRGRRKDIMPKSKRVGIKFRNKKCYECSVCGKKMTQSSTLKSHMRIHTGERPYQCPSCPKTFTFYQCLWNHSWHHKTEKSFPCDKCPKKFRYYQCLWNHHKVHSKKEPFACDVCMMTFTTSSHLVDHVKKRPHNLEAKIKNCGTRCLRTSDISEMPFKCEICSKSFRFKVSLTSHTVKHHSMKPKFSLRKKKKGKDVSLTENKTGPSQNQKRGRGRPRKHSGMKEVEREIFVKDKECTMPISKQHHNQKRGRGRPRKHSGMKEVEREVFVKDKECTMPVSKQHHNCSTCNKVSSHCMCSTAFRAEKQMCNLSPSTKMNTHNLNGQSQIHPAKLKKEISCVLNAKIKDLPKNVSCDENIFPKPLLRRSRRLRGERALVLECNTCCQWLTCTSEQNEHLECHASTNHYECQFCSRSYKSVSGALMNQHLVHKDTQKEMSYMGKLQKDGLEMKPSRKHKHKCSCCGTVFVSHSYYKKHIAYQACTCGQQFQCAYIFNFHSSTCGEHNVPVWEDIADQQSEDSTRRFITDENIHDDLLYLNDIALPAQKTSESFQAFTDDFSVVLDTNDPLPSSTIFNHYQSEGWCMQLIYDLLSSEDSGMTTYTDQAQQNSSSEFAADLLLAPEASDRPKWNDKVNPCKEANDQIQITEKGVDIKQKYQCIVCSMVFSTLSELSTHNLIHLTDI